MTKKNKDKDGIRMRGDKIMEETHMPNNPCGCGSEWIAQDGVCNRCYQLGKKKDSLESKEENKKCQGD